MGDHVPASLGNITSATDNQCLFDGLLCARHFLSLNFHKHESQILIIIPIFSDGGK